MTSAQLDVTLGGQLQTCLQEALDGQSVRLARQEQLKANVHRLGVVIDGWERMLIVKWSDPVVARRSRLVACRWLPAVGLGDLGPPLLTVAAERNGEGAWQIYEDLPGKPLSTEQPVVGEVEAVIDAIARVHTSFAEHPLLRECRLWGGDRGIHFYSANVHDAVIALHSLDLDLDRGDANAIAARDALLERMHLLEQEEPERAQSLASAGGPDTLLHGDLWPTNAIVQSRSDGFSVRLIDWDEVAAGPSWYDVSTLMLRFDPSHRRWILDAYRQAVARLADWPIPGDRDLNLIFETCAYARLASLLVWSVAAAAEGDSGWLPERLAAMVEWLDAVRPVLPTP